MTDTGGKQLETVAIRVFMFYRDGSRGEVTLNVNQLVELANGQVQVSNRTNEGLLQQLADSNSSLEYKDKIIKRLQDRLEELTPSDPWEGAVVAKATPEQLHKNPRKHGSITVDDACEILVGKSSRYVLDRIHKTVKGQHFDGVVAKDNGAGPERYWVPRIQIEAHRDWLINRRRSR